MGTFSGKKFSNAHSTAIDAAVPVIKMADQMPEVSKISLGYIQPIRGGGPGVRRIKTDSETEAACIKVTVRGGTSIQELRIYTNDKQAVLTALSELG